ncbi:MAG: HrcA family transcriptional regulator [Gammaproteobacteria bacterium SG8_47]|nr:MAG: HrcA family transcriptional regulator [Gammaproteobacteria bacterium SG8_47]
MAQQLELSDRAQRLFKVLVERYIREGQPVGSRTLTKEAGIALSPASVRNVMQDLEEVGLLRAPHTSAGRVPTARGLRFFIDTLLKTKPIDEQEVRRLKAHLNPDSSTSDLVEAASSMLSEVTKLAGVVMLPRRPDVSIRQVEFLPLSANRVLVITVVNEREVQNRIINTSRNYSPAELQEAANYINREFGGRSLKQMREALLRGMQETREGINRLMMTAIEMASKGLQAEEDAGDFVLRGEANLIHYAEMGDMGKLRQLFDAFGQKRDILHLLDESLRAEGMQIFVGEESGYDVFGECSLITSPYLEDGRVVGVLGVIGPTRMAYDRVIPIVDVTAKLLGSALKPS